LASVTVIAGSLVEADVDATAAYALGQRAVAWLSTRSGRKGLVVWADGRVSLVEGPGLSSVA
jgi:thiamine biosynthesis lipoprotein